MQALRQRDEKLCRVRDVLDRVGDKWSLAVVNELAGGSRRFTQIKHAIPGISQRMLTSTLRVLERDGMLARAVHPVMPPHVDYADRPGPHLSSDGLVASRLGLRARGRHRVGAAAL